MLLLDYWLPMVGFESHYEVSFSGYARRCKTKEIKKTHLEEHGYPCINILSYGAKRLHRFIAKTFVPNPYNKPEVNHIDGIKINSCANNLEWATQTENRQHAIRIGLVKQPFIPTQNQLEFIERYSHSLTTKEIADILKVTKQSVYKVSGKTGMKHGKVIIDLHTGIFYTSYELAFQFGTNRKQVCRMLNEERKPNTSQYRYV